MNRQWISAILMTAAGGCIFAASDLYKPQPAVAIVSEAEADIRPLPAVTSLSDTETMTDAKETEEETKEEFQPSPEELNLAHYFPEDADTEDLSKSYGGKAFIELMTQDGLWMNSIYDYADLTPEQLASRLGQPRTKVMGDFNPKDEKHDPDNPDTWTVNSFRNIRTTVTNGDGEPISAYSNVIDIMSVANVYSYYKNAGDYDLFLSCAKALWEVSHSYSISMSELYYCDGCLSEEDERKRLEREAEAEEEAARQAVAQAQEGSRAVFGGVGNDHSTRTWEKTIIAGTKTARDASRKNASDTQPSREAASVTESDTETGNGELQAANPESKAGEADDSKDNADSAGASAASKVIQPAASASEGISNSMAAGESPAEVSEQKDASAENEQESDTASPKSSSLVLIAGQGTASPSAAGSDSAEEITLPKATPSDVSETVPAQENITEENTNEENAVKENKNGKDASEPQKCPGHVELIIHMRIRGIKENDGLFKRDPYGNNPDNIEENGWQGWNQETMDAARYLSSQDWYQKYGLTVSAFSMRNPLTSYEIEEYMERLPRELSETRRNVIRFALSSVGKVPYYWGGKPSAPNYSRNNFGTLISPDEKGRILRGLDCSGWINWVYWSVTGNRLPYESTSGLAICGSPVSRDNLQPGDIIIRTGESAHVIMFLEWTEDGRIRCIHESSGDVNNVTVAVRDANWPYYRKLID